MNNRKFDIKKDFAALNELENEIMPILDKADDSEKLKAYVRRIFSNQWKRREKNELYVDLNEVVDAFIDWMKSDDCFITNENGEILNDAIIQCGNIERHLKRVKKYRCNGE
jgi:hypothetical protein